MKRGAPAEPASSWFGSENMSEAATRQSTGHGALDRLWHGFMTARVMIALMLLVMQGTAYLMGLGASLLVLDLSLIYLIATIAVRLFGRAAPPGRTFDPQWISTIAVDVVAFSALQFFQGGNISFTPLFALPILLSAVLGTLALALGTASAITILLLADAWWMARQMPVEAAARFLQAALTGSGLFVVSLLAHQLAARLIREQAIAQRHASEALVQTRVNQLVIENLTDGVLVVDGHRRVRATNPAARHLMDADRLTRHPRMRLSDDEAWQALARLADQTFAQGSLTTTDVDLEFGAQHTIYLMVRTQLAATQAEETGNLCVMFMQDRREVEARIREEKLAAMGRMSAAVAHEIRNPLAAIAQANALLAEDLDSPARHQLTAMIHHNTERLSRIVDEILDVARVEHLPSNAVGTPLPLDEVVAAMSAEWTKQNAEVRTPVVIPAANRQTVRFDTDHLRRVLINLLDNARRYASHSVPIEVSTRFSLASGVELRVWSDGPALEPTVRRHLFEPFFSSHSRSSGLGLYICRELCERHQATISYARTGREFAGQVVLGNEFCVRFARADINRKPTRPDARSKQPT